MDLDNLIELKEKLNISSVELSARSGVPLSTVYKIFQRHTENPRSDTIKALENALWSACDDKATYQNIPSSYLTFNEPAPYGSYIAGSEARKSDMAVKKPGEYTTDDLDSWPEDVRAELIDGVIYDMAAPNVIHQIIVAELLNRILNYIKSNHGKCIAVAGPVGVRPDCDNKTEVEPDITVLCDRGKLKGGRIYGAPDLIIEVLSPSNRKHDTVRKLKKYRSAGVREYWIVDPEEKIILVHLFGDNYSITAYTFRDNIPISIYDAGCVISFSEINDELTDIFGEDY